MPAGSLSKAALVGANTVKGPALFRVSTRPAAFTAATSVVWSELPMALSTMSLSAVMATPSTITPPGLAMRAESPATAAMESAGLTVLVVSVSVLVVSVLQLASIAVVARAANRGAKDFFMKQVR